MPAQALKKLLFFSPQAALLKKCPGGSGFTLEPQPISDRPVVSGFSHRAGRFRHRGSMFSSPGCPSCRCTEGFLNPGRGPPRVRRDRGVSPRGTIPVARSSPSHWGSINYVRNSFGIIELVEHSEKYFMKSLKNVSCEYDRLND